MQGINSYPNLEIFACYSLKYKDIILKCYTTNIYS